MNRTEKNRLSKYKGLFGRSPELKNSPNRVDEPVRKQYSKWKSATKLVDKKTFHFKQFETERKKNPVKAFNHEY